MGGDEERINFVKQGITLYEYDRMRRELRGALVYCRISISNRHTTCTLASSMSITEMYESILRLA